MDLFTELKAGTEAIQILDDFGPKELGGFGQRPQRSNLGARR